MATATVTSIDDRPLEALSLHGHRMAYRQGGSGPVLVLVHGVTGSCDTWRSVFGPLTRDFAVLAPDLLGHGGSAKPHGDYSLGAQASLLRDLLALLGHERATLVGHSLGGGIAMQFAYQFPETVERLVLVSSGGLGSEVNLVLRAAALPGAEYVLPLLAHPRLAGAATGALRELERIGVPASPDLAEIVSGYASLADAGARSAFISTVKSVLDTSGQRATARDKLYLSADMPTLIVWGSQDRVIPPSHGEHAHREMPASRLAVLDGAGHFPHLAQPHRFVAELRDFAATTQPSPADRETHLAHLRARA